MGWDKDDYYAAAFIIGIIILGILAILWITGNNPHKSDITYPFGWLIGILALLGIISSMQPKFS